MKDKINTMRYLKFALIFAFIFCFISVGNSLKNPSQVYCTQMNYSFVIENIPEGEIGMCYFPDGTSCDAWDFYQGVCGTEHSFCSLEGYGVESTDDMDICNSSYPGQLCTSCILPNGSHISVDSLMNLDFREGVCGDFVCAIGETYANCPSDCLSGSADGYCDGVEDGICDVDCTTQEDIDCLPVCGDEQCEEGENYSSCPSDCPSGIKDGVCDKLVDGKCDPDCLVTEDSDCQIKKDCGNDVCDFDENYLSCPEDCSSGSQDGYCDTLADGLCDPDCLTSSDPDCQKTKLHNYWWLFTIMGILILIAVFVVVRNIIVKKVEA